MRISDWSSDVCSSDLHRDGTRPGGNVQTQPTRTPGLASQKIARPHCFAAILLQERLQPRVLAPAPRLRRRSSTHHPARPGSTSPYCRASRASDIPRSEEHTSELQSLMRLSYAVFCLKKKTRKQKQN